MSPGDDTTFDLVPGSRFTIEQLTAAYNNTRVDYLVPLPMNAARLADYIRQYDVDLDRSVVVVAEGEMVGLGMLGVRPRRAWITRLGVLPVMRRRGIGRAMADALLAVARRTDVDETILEVIANNTPASHLFLSCGFRETGELLVLRRPPGPPAQPPPGEARWLKRAEALALLDRRSARPSWLNEAESLQHAANLRGLMVNLPGGDRGWLVFQEERFRSFPLMLSHLAPQTDRGDPVVVGRALLTHLYQRFPDLDTQAENIPAGDPHVPAFFALGYVEAFRRIEMHRGKAGGPGSGQR